MIVIRKQHKEAVLEGRKTEFWSLGENRWTPGSVQGLTTNARDPEATFAQARITAVRRDWITSVLPQTVKADGFATRREWVDDFRKGRKVNGQPMTASQAYSERAWMVRFEVLRGEA